MRRILLDLALILFLFASCSSQDISGKYSISTLTGDVVLSIDNQGGNKYTGSLTGNGNKFPLQGKLQHGYLSGTINYESQIYLFEAILYNEILNFTMANVDEYNQPIASTVQTLVFERSSAKAGISNIKETAQGKIVINGKTLSTQEIAALKQQYGVEPMPGNYWYDQFCGLYGVVGYAAYGFMYPGHNFGPMDLNASNGNTNVIINGRELNQTEYTVWSYILGYWIQAGSYWLDENGNAGYEGSSTILVNLYTAAQQNSYNSGGGSVSEGGDNFWSTKFSAGNSDQGGSRGYVSVPGYGPIGYGF